MVKLLRLKMLSKAKPSRIQMTSAMTMRKMSLRTMITSAMQMLMWLIIEALYRVQSTQRKVRATLTITGTDWVVPKLNCDDQNVSYACISYSLNQFSKICGQRCYNTTSRNCRATLCLSLRQYKFLAPLSVKVKTSRNAGFWKKHGLKTCKD